MIGIIIAVILFLFAYKISTIALEKELLGFNPLPEIIIYVILVLLGVSMLSLGLTRFI